MRRKKNRGFWKNFKSVCYGNTAIKSIIIPITLITAQLLSIVIQQATSGNINLVVRTAFFMLLLLLISIALQTGTTIWIRKRQSKAVNECKIDFMETLLNNPVHRLFYTDYGELMENCNSDIDILTNRYTELYPSIVSSTLELLGYFVFLVLQCPIVGGSLLVIALLQLFPPLIVKKYMQINYDKCREMEAKITDHIVEAIDGFEVIKLYELKHWWLNKIKDYYKDYLYIGWKTDAVAAAQRSMYRLLDNILKFGTYTILGIYAILGYCTMDVAIQAIYLSSGFYSAVKTLFSLIPEVAVAYNAEKRMNKWDYPENSDNKNFFPSSTIDMNMIDIHNLFYSYKNSNIINGISYQFDSHNNYLLKGSNGAGKTTLMSLLVGLLLPDRGEVLIDGIDLRRIQSLPNPPSLLYIPQHDPKYSFNIQTLFGMFGPEKQRLLDSIAKRFGLTEEIITGNAIRDLSGGQRKKIFLSIGFAMQPQWLLLDEPANDLDSHGQTVLFELLSQRKGTILISHDQIFDQIADCVISIENGRIHNEKRKTTDGRKADFAHGIS